MKSKAVIAENVDCYNMHEVVIGEGALISQRAVLCGGSHDVTDQEFTIIARPIVIEKGAWVAAEAFIGPGVTVGEGAVIGARAVVFSNAEPWTIYVGNPARAIKRREIRRSIPGAEAPSVLER
jgi:putative colanic acid biosynthesis acetyltransferase WcaF